MAQDTSETLILFIFDGLLQKIPGNKILVHKMANRKVEQEGVYDLGI